MSKSKKEIIDNEDRTMAEFLKITKGDARRTADYGSKPPT